MRPLVRTVHRASRRLRPQTSWSDDGETLLCFYDLARWPITFDFLWFLAAADATRRQQRLKHIHIILVAPRSWDEGPESADYLKFVDGQARRQRIFDILLPATDLVPNVADIVLIEDRARASRLVGIDTQQIFPPNYTPETPFLEVPFPAMVIELYRTYGLAPDLRASPAALVWARRRRASHQPGRRLVTITLRDYDYLPSRNSDLEAWTTLATELSQDGYHIVFVPDTHAMLDGLPETLESFDVAVEAAWNLAMRAALYEIAYLNLGVNTGPLVACWLNPQARYYTFKMIVDDAPVTQLENVARRGLDTSEPYPFATRHQMITADADEIGILRREVFAMLERLEKDGSDTATDAALRV